MNGVSKVFYHEISFLPISAWRPYQITFRLSVKLRQWRVISGTSEDKMRRDNSAPHMLKNRPATVPSK